MGQVSKPHLNSETLSFEKLIFSPYSHSLMGRKSNISQPLVVISAFTCTITSMLDYDSCGKLSVRLGSHDSHCWFYQTNCLHSSQGIKVSVITEQTCWYGHRWGGRGAYDSVTFVKTDKELTLGLLFVSFDKLTFPCNPEKTQPSLIPQRAYNRL